MNAGGREGEQGASQTSVVIDEIKRMILAGDVRRGDRLPVEKDLAARLGVSRGSLREGVRALAHMGVLETRQGDGTYVTKLDAATLLSPLGFLAELDSDTDPSHLLAVRRVLEAESAGVAAQIINDEQLDALAATLHRADAALAQSEPDLDAFLDADTEFHNLVALAAGNPPLAALIANLVGRTARARAVRAMSQRGSVNDAQAEHYAILAELGRHDSHRARIRMEAHVLGVEEFARTHRLGDPSAAQ